MSREIRNGRLYYYRTQKINGRVVKTYGGSGDAAQALSQQDLALRAEQESLRRDFAAEQERYQAVEREVAQFSLLVNVLLTETLTQAGYQRHNRSEWRKTRVPVQVKAKEGKKMSEVPVQRTESTSGAAVILTKTAMVKATPVDPVTSVAPSLFTPEEMLAEIKRTDISDPERERLARVIVETPGLEGLRPLLINACGGQKPDPDLLPAACALARVIPLENVPSRITTMGRNAIIGAICGGNQLAKIVEGRHADALLQEIAGDNPTPLEKLLAHRIVANGLLVTEAEASLARASAAPTATVSLPSMKRVLFWEKRVDAATRRYLASIRALAQVRKLQLPTMQIALSGSTQVNIAEKQVNLAQVGAQQVNI